MRNTPIPRVLVFLLPVLMAAPPAFADTAAAMQKAKKLYNGKKFAQAEQKYQDVINNADPGDPEDLDRVVRARKKLAQIYIATDQQPKAKAAVLELLAKHSDAELLPRSVHEIVEQAKRHDRALQAGRLYQDIITSQPDHPQVLWLKMGGAIADVYLGDDSAVNSAIQNIISQHNGDKGAAVALAQTGWAY